MIELILQDELESASKRQKWDQKPLMIKVLGTIMGAMKIMSHLKSWKPSKLSAIFSILEMRNLRINVHKII